MMTILAPKSSQNRLIKILVCTMLGIHSPLFQPKHSYMEGKSWKEWAEVLVCVYLGQLTAIFLSAVAPPLLFFIVWNGVTRGTWYQRRMQHHLHHSKEKGAPNHAYLEIWWVNIKGCRAERRERNCSMTEHCYVTGRCFAYIGSKRQRCCQAIKELPLCVAFYSYTILRI